MRGVRNGLKKHYYSVGHLSLTVSFLSLNGKEMAKKMIFYLQNQQNCCFIIQSLNRFLLALVKIRGSLKFLKH